ncbi:hypothetical protein GE061_013553 [Apolygus lucorum]|uniref:Uncharacterized protein n=1 Tax=Apolygus lucorum TaxID=248454 RepID=A0A8S9XNA3_APOLU|nr:hypothetical protein GE061_013553 [Apolygus lucorum]
MAVALQNTISLSKDVILLLSAEDKKLYRSVRTWSIRACSLLEVESFNAEMILKVKEVVESGTALLSKIDESDMDDSISTLLTVPIVQMSTNLLKIIPNNDQSTFLGDITAPPVSQSPKSVLDAVKLMNIMLSTVPEYEGDVAEFPTFQKLFDAAVHLVPMLPDEIKFQSLASKLVGDARSVIAGASSKDYQRCYDTLCAENTGRYRVARRTFSNRHHIPAIVSSQAIDLEKFLFAAENWDRAMQNLPTNDPAGYLRFEVLFPKLSSELRDKFNRDEMEDVNLIPTSNDLFTFIKKELRIAQMLPIDSRSSNVRSTSQKVSKPRHTQVFSTRQDPNVSRAILDSSAPRSSNLLELSCHYCNDHHYLYHCGAFKAQSVESRRAFVDHSKLCRNCLSYKHNTKDCKSPRSCFCGLRHHQLLHSDQSRQVHIQKYEVSKLGSGDERAQSDPVNVSRSSSPTESSSGALVLTKHRKCPQSSSLHDNLDLHADHRFSSVVEKIGRSPSAPSLCGWVSHSTCSLGDFPLGKNGKLIRDPERRSSRDLGGSPSRSRQIRRESEEKSFSD